ncbi:acetyl-CoA synthetase [Caballeronia catudaia]|uniref:Acetyl-CoA synthetase n=1 Tax=Caballeronia catudaia TaxID=1777136 RepID=A0A158C7J8_9BURK|nr:acetyl-CoA synthetase [Caballeronia catudaia]
MIVRCSPASSSSWRGNESAIIFEADDGTVTNVTYQDLLDRVRRLANALKKRGVKKGDRVVIVVFGGFSSKLPNERLVDVGAVALITADEEMRGGRTLPLKRIADEALAAGGCEKVTHVIVYRRTGGKVAWTAGRDVWLHEIVERVSSWPMPLEASYAAAATQPACRE